MRVLIASTFVSPHVGGVERYVDWLRASLAAEGHEVRLVAAARPAHADLVVPSISPGAGSVGTVPVAIPGPRSLGRLRQLVRWADVVVIQNCFYTLSFAVACVARAAGVPARTIVHANSNAIPGMGFTSRLLATGYARTLGAIQLHLAPPFPVSHSGACFLVDEYGVTGEVLTFPLGTLPTRQPPAPPTRDTPLDIVWAGRLAPAKAPAIAVRAVERLRNEQPCRLHVYGDGPLASSLPKADWVVRYGMRPWNEVVAAQARAHVFLSTSIADNVQTSLLEAAAMGVPSVATDVGEAAAYLRGDLSSLLCPINDPVRIARALGDVARDWAALDAAASATATALREEHDVAGAALQVEALLRGAVAQSATRGRR